MLGLYAQDFKPLQLQKKLVLYLSHRCLGYFVTETQYPTPITQGGKVYLGSQFIEVSVHQLLTPRQGGMAERHGRGETVQSMVEKSERSREEERR